MSPINYPFKVYDCYEDIGDYCSHLRGMKRMAIIHLHLGNFVSYTVSHCLFHRSALQLFTNHSSRPDAIGGPGRARLGILRTFSCMLLYTGVFVAAYTMHSCKGGFYVAVCPYLRAHPIPLMLLAS